MRTLDLGQEDSGSERGPISFHHSSRRRTQEPRTLDKISMADEVLTTKEFQAAILERFATRPKAVSCSELERLLTDQTFPKGTRKGTQGRSSFRRSAN